MNKIPHRLYLTEDQMPRQWYNLRADMPSQPDPMLNPGTLQPVTEEELCPIFCQELAHRILQDQPMTQEEIAPRIAAFRAFLQSYDFDALFES